MDARKMPKKIEGDLLYRWCAFQDIWSFSSSNWRYIWELSTEWWFIVVMTTWFPWQPHNYWILPVFLHKVTINCPYIFLPCLVTNDSNYARKLIIIIMLTKGKNNQFTDYTQEISWKVMKFFCSVMEKSWKSHGI